MELGAGRHWARVAGRTARSRCWASVRAGRARRARQTGVSGRGAQGVQGGRRTGAGGRARARASGSWAAGRWARGRQALGARQACARRAGRARPGRLGWPWAVHSVHSAHFRSVLTRFFS